MGSSPTTMLFFSRHIPDWVSPGWANGVSGRLASLSLAYAYFGLARRSRASARTRALFGLLPQRVIGHNYLYGIFSTDSLAKFNFRVQLPCFAHRVSRPVPFNCVCRFRASRVASPAPLRLARQRTRGLGLAETINPNRLNNRAT